MSIKSLCLMLLALVAPVLVKSGGKPQDAFRNKEAVIKFDWASGTVRGDSVDINWTIYSCGDNAPFICLIVEGYGIELAYPKGVNPGEVWYFDGRIYRLAMAHEDELLIVSRFTDKSMSHHKFLKSNRISIIRIRKDSLLEFVSYEESSQFDEYIRWKSDASEGVNLAPSLTGTETRRVGKELVDKCARPDSINCLAR